ncbi:MAG: SPOR domain-containing protein, partial [Pseudomonadota bacterium]
VPQVLAQNPDSGTIEAPTAGVMTIMPEGEPEPAPRPEPAPVATEVVEESTATAVETVEAPLLPTSKPAPSEQEQVQQAVEEVVAELSLEPEAVPLTPQGRLAQPASTGHEFAPDYSPRVIKRPPDLEQKALEARENSAENEAAAADQLALLAQQSRIKVQLQASPNRDDIISSWNRIRSQHGDIVGQKSLAVQLTKSGGVTYYRLRLGPFRDRTEAKAVCSALKARNQDCIVTSDG